MNRRKFFGTVLGGFALACGWKAKPPLTIGAFDEVRFIEVPPEWQSAFYQQMQTASLMLAQDIKNQLDSDILKALSG